MGGFLMRTRAFLVAVALAMLVLTLAAGCGGATTAASPPEAKAALDKVPATVNDPYLAGLEGKGLPAIAYYKQFQEASRLNGSQH